MSSNFDTDIKIMIDNESYDMPEDFKNKIKSILNDLPEDNNGLKNRKNNNKLKIFLIASIVTVLITATAFATIPELLKMTHNFIGSLTKINNVNILSKQEEFEKYNAPVGYTSESEGISVTIDNIAVDGNFLLISSTIKSNRTIEDIIKDSWIYNKSLEMEIYDSESIDYKRFLNNIVPRYYFKIDGVDYERLDRSDHEEYLKDEYTFITVQKYILPTEVPDIFKLSISEKYICHTKGDWSFDIAIDKSESNKDLIAVTPEIQADVTSIVFDGEYKHHITIEKLSISPFGGQITLSEKGPEVFRDFTLRDKYNNYYMVFNDSILSSKDISENTFEFIYSNKDEKPEEFELVPILTHELPVQKTVTFGNTIESTDIKTSNIGGYKVDSVICEDNAIKITLKPYGVILHYRSLINGALGILEKDEKKYTNITMNDIEYDKTNGDAIVTITCNNANPQDVLNNIKGFWYISIPNMELNEKETVKIPLK